jgi:hypothetical protein
MRCKVEFTLRGQDIFDGKELPGTESVLSCVSDIKGYGRKMREWQVSFMVSQSILSIEDAFDRFWNNRGSLRVTTMEPLKHDESTEVVKSNVPEKPADPKQPSLFDPDKIEAGSKSKKGGVIYRQKFDAKTKEFTSPDEFVVPMPISGAKHACVISIGEGPNGQFYATSRIDFVDSDGDTDDLDYGNPKYEGDGCQTEKAAVEKCIGSLIDVVARDCEVPKVLDDLRNELKRLADGAEPIPMPDA